MIRILLPVALFLTLGCQQNSKEYKRFYYKNGRIKEEGFYNKLNKPIDTLRGYSSTGQLSWLAVYDDSSRLHGTNVVFFANGLMEQKRHYRENVLNGEFMSFYPNGQMRSTCNYRDGLIQGDKLHFYEDGLIKAYNFYDFKERNCRVHYFDSSTKKRIQDDGYQIVDDSIAFIGDTVYLTFLVSHPPFSSNQISISEVNKSGVRINFRNVPDTSGYFNISFFEKPLPKSLIFEVLQYDSLTGKKKEFNTIYQLHE